MAKKKIEKEEAPKYQGKKYRIFFDKTPEGLEEQIDAMIAKSWRVAGGVAVNTKGFYQSMTKGF
jgi:hypothetical protein